MLRSYRWLKISADQEKPSQETFLMLREHKNPSTELSTDTRELIAHLVGPLHKRGISRQIFRDCLAEAGAPVSKASLDRWLYDYTESGNIFNPVKVSGAAVLLDAQQQEVAAGWVLIENDEHRPVLLAV